MVKKIFGILAVLVLSLATVWAAGDFSTENGDFQGFYLRESRDKTLSRYDARLKNGFIWSGDVDSDGTIRFQTRAADDIFKVELDFVHKQLARIVLVQRDGISGLNAAKLRHYIDEKLIPAVSEEYGSPEYVFEFPRVSEIDVQPYILAEWLERNNRVTVGVAQDKKLRAVVMIDAVELVDGN